LKNAQEFSRMIDVSRRSREGVDGEGRKPRNGEGREERRSASTPTTSG
jgi:hypothetical protein